MLSTISKVLTAQELAQVRACLSADATPWADGKVTAGDQSAKVKNNSQLPEECEPARHARAIVSAAFARHPMFVTQALPKTIYPPLFNRYAGAHNVFGAHIDNAVRTHSASARHVRTDLSCTLFLSDPQTYDGGELVIEDAFGERSVKLAAGDAVLYPGTSVHRVNAVTRGERLACFFWIESMIRRDDQRTLLNQLDMAILKLRTREGDTHESVALTGCYHNLLRMWADVNG